MKRIIPLLVTGFVFMSVGADSPTKPWDTDWDRKSFGRTLSMLSLRAREDGKVTDEELLSIGIAAFRILEPEDKRAKLVSQVRSDGDLRVVFVAHDYGAAFIGYDFTFSKDGHFVMLVRVPSA